VPYALRTLGACAVGVLVVAAAGCGDSASIDRLALRVVPRQSDLGSHWRRISAKAVGADKPCRPPPDAEACALSYFDPAGAPKTPRLPALGAAGLATVYQSAEAAQAAFSRGEAREAAPHTLTQAHVTQKLTLVSRTPLPVDSGQAVLLVVRSHIEGPRPVDLRVRGLLIEKGREVVLLTVTSPTPLDAGAVAARIARRM